MVETVPAERFRELLHEEPSLPLIDTRAAADYAAWHIPGAANFGYAPGDDLDGAALGELIPTDADRVLTVCAWGISSVAFADAVEAHGFPPVVVLEDGMVAWSRVYDVAEVPLDGAVSCWQLQRLAKGCLGYVVACDRTDAAVAIDAPVHHDEVVDLLDARDLELTAVVDTHVHADHVSGGPALARRHAVPYHIGAGASDRGLEHEHRPLADGATLDVGECRLIARETPGHTSEMVNLVLADADAVFTADTLFVDAVGRTELEADASAGTRASELYRSITGVLLSLAPETTVLPGHFDPAGDRVRPPGTPVTATLGEVRESVELLGVDESTFVERVVDRSARRPPNYRAITLVNLGSGPLPGVEVLAQLELGPNRCAATA